SAKFQPMDAEAGANTAVSSALKQGETIAFKVSGNGEFPRDSEAAGTGDAGAAGGGAPDSRPGGGLGTPIDAPDPLRQYRWYILGGLAVAMVAGGIYVMKRGPANGGAVVTAAAPPSRSMAAPAASRSSVLDALKEELFQLEVERQQQQI